MLFCDSRWQCFAWLVNLTAVAIYSIFPYFWCSTVDSIQFHVAICTAVSCRWRYITDISLVQLRPWSGPKCLPATTHTHTHNMCVMRGCVVLPSFTDCNKLQWHNGVYTWSDNKVRELATLCLLWQHWTKALVWFDDLAYQRFTAVLLLIYGSLFLSGILYCLCVLVSRRENVGTWIRATNKY